MLTDMFLDSKDLICSHYVLVLTKLHEELLSHNPVSPPLIKLFDKPEHGAADPSPEDCLSLGRGDMK